MAKIVKKTRKNITILSNKIINNSNLSWKARGIFLYLWHLPKNWSFHENEISNHATDGIHSLISGIQELEHFHYLTIERARTNRGQLKESRWIMNDNPDCDNRNVDNRNYGKRNYANRNLLNTNNTKHLFKQNTDSTNLPQSKSEKEFADIDNYVEKNWTVTIPITKRKQLNRLMCEHSYQSIIKAISIAADNGIGIKGLVGYIASVLSNDQKPRRKPNHKDNGGDNDDSKYSWKNMRL